MSVDYSARLIYGYELTEEEVDKIKQDLYDGVWQDSEGEAYETLGDLSEHFDNFPVGPRLIKDDHYTNKPTWFFGLEMEDTIEPYGGVDWYVKEVLMRMAYCRLFSDGDYAETPQPKLHCFLGVY